jgi:hypothetical protein
MRDWDQFLEQNPWFLHPGDVATVGEEQPWSRGGVARLPQLSALLASATLTPVSIAGKEYEVRTPGLGTAVRPPRLALPPAA